MPTYYVMELGKTMPQNVAASQPSTAEILACKWLTEPELGVLFSGKTIDVPSLFIGGKSDGAPQRSPCPEVTSNRTIELPQAAVGDVRSWPGSVTPT
jgi:hypothetical protein